MNDFYFSSKEDFDKFQDLLESRFLELVEESTDDYDTSDLMDQAQEWAFEQMCDE